MLSDLGDGGIATDHRHDALVLVPEGLRRFVSDFTQDVLGCPPARLLGGRAQLWQGWRAVVTGGDVRDVADGVDTRMAVDREVPSYVEPSATADDRPEGLRDCRARFATAPPHGSRRDRGVVIELDPVGVNGGDA